MVSPFAHFAARVVADWRLRFLVTVALATMLMPGLMLSLDPAGDVYARSRTIHPCLLGDEPCNTPAPTPGPR